MSSVTVACSALPPISSSTSTYHGQLLYLNAVLSAAQHLSVSFVMHLLISGYQSHFITSYALTRVSILDSDWLEEKKGHKAVYWKFGSLCVKILKELKRSSC